MTTANNALTEQRFGLKPQTVEAINQVLAKYPKVERALLYGSRAKGYFRPGSDIDLTLCGELLSYADLSRIETELDDLLLPYLLDISLYSHIDNPNLVEHIQRVGQVLYLRTDC